MTAQKAANRFKSVSAALDSACANLARYRDADGNFFDPATLPEIAQIRAAIVAASAKVASGPELTRTRTAKILAVGMLVNVKGMPGVWTISEIKESGSISLTNDAKQMAFATKQAVSAHKAKGENDDDDDDDDAEEETPAPAKRAGPGRPAARGRMAPPRPNA